jgi:hypothetical protein
VPGAEDDVDDDGRERQWASGYLSTRETATDCVYDAAEAAHMGVVHDWIAIFLEKSQLFS